MRQGDPETWDMAHGEWHHDALLTAEDVALIRECLATRDRLRKEAKACTETGWRIKREMTARARELDNSAKEIRKEMLRKVKEAEAEAKAIRKSIRAAISPYQQQATKLYREASYLSPKALSGKFEASETTIHAIRLMKHWGTK